MKYSFSTIVALANVLTVTFADPASSNTSASSTAPMAASTAEADGSPFSRALFALESQGSLEWTSVDGGRTTKIPIIMIDAIINGTTGVSKLAVRGAPKAPKAPKASTGKWQNAGQIASATASYACEKNSLEGVSMEIDALANDGCQHLVGLVPGAPIAEQAWNIYQGAVQTTAKGDSYYPIFRFFYNTAKAPTLTESICNTTISKLTTTLCQDGNSTKGGEIRVGNDKDFLELGFDTNKL